MNNSLGKECKTASAVNEETQWVKKQLREEVPKKRDGSLSCSLTYLRFVDKELFI